MTQPSPTRRTSPRLVLAALVLAVVSGTAVTAAAASSVTCVGNSDSQTSGSDKGICVVIPLPDLPNR